MPTTSQNPLDDLSPAAQQRREKTLARMEKAGAFLLAPGLVKAPKKKKRRRKKKPTNESHSAKTGLRKASSSPRGARKSKPEKKPAGDDKKKEKGVPLAFEEEADGGADEIVATAELEPWARIGTLRIACQVLEKDGDDLSWQFELADLWFR
jgi:hypothetical protein